jgi:hypothetical protein
MPQAQWTWDARKHPAVAGVVAGPAHALGWCDRLEAAPEDAVVGKVLCVCAAAAVARAVLITLGGDARQADAALELLGRWIDDPTDQRFERICSLIFEEGAPEFDPHGVVWWALRTATSSVGNFEAGWAFGGACAAAVEAGFTPEQLRSLVEQELSSRSRPADRA